jgi:hypothetical protein
VRDFSKMDHEEILKYIKPYSHGFEVRALHVLHDAIARNDEYLVLRMAGVFQAAIAEFLRNWEPPKVRNQINAYSEYVQTWPDDHRGDGTWPVCFDEFIESEWYENWRNERGL